MLMYNKDSDVGVLVSQSQVKMLEKAGWTRIKPEPEKIAVKEAEEATKVQAKIETKASEDAAKKVAPAKVATTKPSIK